MKEHKQHYERCNDKQYATGIEFYFLFEYKPFPEICEQRDDKIRSVTESAVH